MKGGFCRGKISALGRTGLWQGMAAKEAIEDQRAEIILALAEGFGQTARL
jgi:hypothetical protein